MTKLIPVVSNPPKRDNLPVLDHQPRKPTTPVTGQHKQDDPRWVFSFKNWEQIANFGLDRSGSTWFVSLLEKLKEFSTYRFSDFQRDTSLKDHWRYHEIDWTRKNVPINRTDLTWLDQDIYNNPDEYPLFQFQISKALGRIVGYIEKNVFNIVLLDPNHNIQPSRYNDYRIRPCSPLNCEYTILLSSINHVKEKSHCSNESCGYRANLENLIDPLADINIVMHVLDHEGYEHFTKAIDYGMVGSVTELLQYGLLYIEENS